MQIRPGHGINFISVIPLPPFYLSLSFSLSWNLKIIKNDVPLMENLSSRSFYFISFIIFHPFLSLSVVLYLFLSLSLSLSFFLLFFLTWTRYLNHLLSSPQAITYRNATVFPTSPVPISRTNWEAPLRTSPLSVGPFVEVGNFRISFLHQIRFF